ncbi:MAG: diguanylate cyclase [Betaproteobacteria bacterium]|nr:MAG: diguanylate cyclase [Betaproteobacteria bacterium]
MRAPEAACMRSCYQMLRQLSSVLREQVRMNDMLARLGGDEFGVLLEGCPPAKAIEIAEKLHAATQDFRFTWLGKGFSVGISIGMGEICPATESVETVMSQADLACYAAKDAGRNRIHVFSATDAEITRRRSEMEWISRISRAHEEGRISLAVQDARYLKTAARPALYREMLLRMADEDGKPVPTGTLIAAAERFNFMRARRTADPRKRHHRRQPLRHLAQRRPLPRLHPRASPTTADRGIALHLLRDHRDRCRRQHKPGSDVHEVGARDGL